ncbi:MMS19 nucleotide excision repair [Wickerhamiella sorbophila]|uniref:MMS19 nucleotide excision repair protein n=1 Tax=Wickerhamiella sorbophila TaxID=45607 RepID=A0A2T0FMH3_9ASCO|nr:MMS19 nucleotide excision repair [Wickerhamiella sorbophila]PRT56188.1 MMS19 nucleotide excision repair [Wickerhamiella sorbophila]
MQSLINEYMLDNENAEATAQSLAQAVGPDNILEFIRLLGDQLVQQDDNVRLRATCCLSDTLKHITGLNRQQIEVIGTFLTDRLDDSACLLPVSTGLLTLANLSNFPSSLASIILERLVDIEVRREPQVKRNAILRLLDALSKFKSPSFVKTYVDLASGEKDPENLMLLLSLNQKILSNYTLSSSEKEDIFDLSFCYFPVTFTPPKNMPYKITAEEIKEQLRQTLINPSIAEYTIPGLISKLTAISITTKVETLSTLEACLKALDAGQLHAYWLQVWDGVKYEVLHGTIENETHESAINVLRCLITQGDEFTEVVQKEFTNLTNPKLGVQVAHLIVGVTEGYPREFELLANAAVETVVDGPANELNSRVPIINVLLKSSYPVPQGDSILSVLLAGVDGDVDFAKDAIQGLGLLALQSVEFSPLIIQKLTALLNNPQYEETALEVLITLAKPRSGPMVENFLSVLLSELSENWDPANARILNILAKTSVSKELLTKLTVRLYNRALASTETDYVVAMLHCLVTAAGHLDKSELSSFYDTVFPFLKEFVISSSSPAFQANIAIDQACQLGEIAGRAIPSSGQAQYVGKIQELFTKKTHLFGKRPTNLMSLFVSFIVALDEPPRVDISFVDLADTLSHSNDIYERSGYLRLVSVAANKWPQLYGDVDLYIQWLKKSIETDSPSLLNSLELLAWLGRGFILRNDPKGFEIANYLTGLLVHPTLGQFAAKVFGVLLAKDRLLVKDNGIVVRQLFRQRLLVEQLDILVEGARGPCRVNYMIALGAILRYSPAKALIPHLPKVLPIILESFDIPYEAVQLAAIGAVLVTLSDASKLFAAHLDALIPGLLAVSSKPELSATVRSTALSTLAEIANVLGSGAVEPYRQQVISGLVPALGDPKRSVRRQAARCRQAYYS